MTIKNETTKTEISKLHASLGGRALLRQGPICRQVFDQESFLILPVDIHEGSGEFEGISATIRMLNGKALVSLEARHMVPELSVPLCADLSIEQGIALWRKLGETLGLSLMIGEPESDTTEIVVAKLGRMICRAGQPRRKRITRRRDRSIRLRQKSALSLKNKKAEV